MADDERAGPGASLAGVPVIGPRQLLSAAGAFVLGLLVGAVGTVVHRAATPWGLAGALVLVLTAAVTCRAWAGWFAWAGYGGGLYLAIVVLSQTGPGGDVLAPEGDGWAWGWVLGAAVALVLAAVAPRRLFDDTPRPARTGRR